MYQTILFDLDGTLTDPGLGITNAAMYALAHMGYPVPPREELYKFIGPPLHDSFQLYYGMDEAQAAEAVRLYRIYFAENGLFENRVYDGIPEMLSQLQADGMRLVLATSKPEQFAKIIMNHYGLDVLIPEIAGATLDTSRGTKGKVIAYALREFSIDPTSAVMVGDREHDVFGARENGLDTIGVSFGYGSREELASAGAIAVVDSPSELYKTIRKG